MRDQLYTTHRGIKHYKSLLKEERGLSEINWKKTGSFIVQINWKTTSLIVRLFALRFYCIQRQKLPSGGHRHLLRRNKLVLTEEMVDLIKIMVFWP